MLSLSHLRRAARPLLLIVGTLLGVVLLVLLLQSVSLDQLGSDLTDVDYRFLALALPPFLLNWLVKVPRWALLFGRDAPAWDTLFGAMNVGYAINTLLPLRLGEIVRAYWVRDRAGIGMVQTLSTIALERVTDGVTVLVMFLIVAPTVTFPSELLRAAITAGVIFLIALLGMIVLAYGSARQHHLLSRVMGRLERGRWSSLERAARQILTGLRVLSDRRAVALLAVYTAIVWGSNALLVWLVMRAFHLDVPFTAGILMTAVLNLGMAVPSSPGYVGVFDYLFVVTAGLYGEHKTPALAAGLAFHIVAFAPALVVGLIYLGRVGLESTIGMLRTEVGPQEARHPHVSPSPHEGEGGGG